MENYHVLMILLNFGNCSLVFFRALDHQNVQEMLTKTINNQ